MSRHWQSSAGELAAAIARREVSSREVVQSHLDRINTVNPKLNAAVEVLRDQALTAADAADRALESGTATGALHGVPVSVKCNIDMKGLASTWGVAALADAPAAADAPVVERIRAAGAIPIVRTNCPDFAMRVHTDSSLHGLTRNPWSYEHTAGGSSGGEGSAIASGMSPLGLGNDIGGSLRNPASACGIASIKPSAGRVPDASGPPFEDRPLAWQWMAVQGPMARTVADVRLGLQAIMGAHPRDPLATDAPFDGPPTAHPRVAVVPAPPGGDCAAAVQQAVRRAADALADAGYEVVETVPPRYEEVVDTWRRLLAGDYAALKDDMAPMMGDAGRRFFEAFFAGTPPLADTAAMTALLMQRDGLARAWSEFMAEYPLVLGPTWTEPPFEHGADAIDDNAVEKTLTLLRPVMPANLLGLPSACVPAARDGDTGLPIGVLLTGRRFREDECLAAAEAVEKLRATATPIDPAW